MDPTGTELTFIYKNAAFRRMRNDKPEQTIMISQLIDPPQGDEYKELPWNVFPKEYPAPKNDGSFSYFHKKYYITQRLFFSFAKKP